MNYILIQNWIELKPQDKLLYIRWTWLLYDCEDDALTIESLAEMLKMNKSTVRDSVGRLLSSGKIVQSEERGLFRLAMGPLEDSPIKLSDGKKSFIKKVLGYEEDLSKVRAEELSLRLLKAVLVFLCDDLGVINDFRFSYLSKITGMSIQRLRRYRDKLKQDGFILKFVPGGNSPNLYKKALSICIIDPEVIGGGKITFSLPKEEGKGISQAIFGWEPNKLLLRYELADKMLDLESDEGLGDPMLETLIKFRETEKQYFLPMDVENEKYFDLREVLLHKFEQRISHFFDELVSKSIQTILRPEFEFLTRSSKAKTDQIYVNKSLTKLWKKDIEMHSYFLLDAIRKHIVSGARLEKPVDLYFFRSYSAFYILSNIGRIDCRYVKTK